MHFTLNGIPRSVHVGAGESLLALLRERCGIASAKDGCAPEGSCGACTVLVDGRPVVACSWPAERVTGREVTTVDGLPAPHHRQWADTFVAAGAVQCGFCTPGIVVKAEALLRRNPDPSRDEVAGALAGNLCRCTGYVKILDAILAVAALRRDAASTMDASASASATASGVGVGAGAGVGARAPRHLGHDLVLGEAPFVNDLNRPGMLHGALRFSDHPRARIVALDTTRARAVPGVVAVLTAADVPGERVQGELVADWVQLYGVGETTRYVGDVLALVAADSAATARAAAALVEVAYEVLEPVTDPQAALADGAPQLHAHAPGNVLSTSGYARGDVDAALARAAHVVTGTYHTGRIEHAFLEPEASLAVPTPDGGVHVYSQGQGIWSDRRQVAGLLGVPEWKVRVTLVPTGGAFGGKEDLNVQGHAALLATHTGRPVRIALTRAESLRFHVKRHPMTMTYTVGCDADGHLVGLRADIVGDTGAYASVGAKVLERAAGHACGPYRVPDVAVRARAVHTNNVPCGAMRGFGVVQVTFALEGILDRLAERVGIDGWDIRWRNAVDVGDVFGTGQRLGPGVGIRDTLRAVREVYKSARYAGIGCAVKNSGLGNGLTEYGRCVLRPERDGTLSLYHAWTEMGQGVHTVLRQVLCEELGIDPALVHVAVDTCYELDCGQTTASRASVLGGLSVMDAARRLRTALGAAPPTRRVLAGLAGQEYRGEISISGTTPLGADVPDPVTHFAYGWATQVVVLDDAGRLAKVVAAHDVGRALNPTLLEGQIEGAVHMGLGMALSEEYVVAGAVPVTTTLKGLHLIPPAGMPPVECVFITREQPEGPYGAKGVGEIGLVPTPAAVAGALHRFDGVRRTGLPMRDSVTARLAAPSLDRRR